MDNYEFIIHRIEAMEASMERTARAVDALEKALDAYETVKPDIDRLTDYLESGAWREDFEADEAGLVPKGLKRGVLSEDGLYNLLADIVRVNELMQEQLDGQPESTESEE
ncbi:MAG: DUF4298 domain-containing protein [Bacteroidales bacterium]|nr:DUF4298 domain-containing protein [Bacteroidales bacterium]